MSTPDFGELVGRIRGPLTSLGSTLPREEASEVDEPCSRRTGRGSP